MTNTLEGNARNHNQFWDDEDEVLSPEAFAVHPGLFLKRNVLSKHEITASALADHIGVARPGLNNMLNGKRALTADMALLIGAALNYPADLLVRMMANHELAEAREAKAALIESIAAMAAVHLGQLEEPANENHKVRVAM